MSKKHLIMEKSVELFAEHGFEATSVQQITERCGISKGAFYLYFKSKDELIINLIDTYMGRMITDIEQSVNNEKNSNQLLFNLLYLSFSEFQKQAHFAKIFMKEQVFYSNKELLDQIQKYVISFNKIILSIIKRQFPNLKSEMYLDTLFTINGLIQSYSELFLIDDEPIDIDLLCKSIVEKVTIITKHMTIPIMTPKYYSKLNIQHEFSKETVMHHLEEAIQETGDDPLVQESLILLKEHLINPHLNETIVQGLINNVRTNINCGWIGYLLKEYLSQDKN